MPVEIILAISTTVLILATAVYMWRNHVLENHRIRNNRRMDNQRVIAEAMAGNIEALRLPVQTRVPFISLSLLCVECGVSDYVTLDDILMSPDPGTYGSTFKCNEDTSLEEYANGPASYRHSTSDSSETPPTQ